MKGNVRKELPLVDLIKLSRNTCLSDWVAPIVVPIVFIKIRIIAS